MELIDVQPKELLFMYAFTSTDLKKLSLLLNNMQFNCNGADPEHIKAKEYLENKFYPAIEEGMKVMEGTNDG